jgi:hypothetical protein
MLHSDLLISSLPYIVAAMVAFTVLPQSKLLWKITVAGVLMAARMVHFRNNLHKNTNSFLAIVNGFFKSISITIFYPRCVS